jgi:glycosyltransferase involved in cell wall biosynthesis
MTDRPATPGREADHPPHHETPPLVSVVVCTRNRSRHLASALRSLVSQDPISPSFEIIVVDNASSDDTPDVARAFGRECRLRHVIETRPGLCHARNRGGYAALGRYVAYLDDDAIASRSWVSAVAEAFALCPDAGAVGGRVEPVWHARRPRWLSDHVARALTIVDWPGEPRILEDLTQAWVVGANMAVRADVFRAIGGFRPQLDRVGAAMLSSGDIFFLKEVIRAGSHCYYYPAMSVEHAVPAARLTKQWFRSRYYWQGVSDAVMELLEAQPTPSGRRRLARGAVARLMTAPSRFLTLLPTNDPDRFAETCWTLIAIGHAVGLWTMRDVVTPHPARRTA